MPEFHRDPKVTGHELADLKGGSDRKIEVVESFALSTQEIREKIKAREKKNAPERIVEKRCHVCTHPYRDFIETMLVRGSSYLGIEQRVTPHVDRRSISNHYKNHMDLQDAALRYILEQEAKLQGQNFEEGVQDLVTKRGGLEVMFRKGLEDVQSGVTTVEPRDLVQIVKVLSDMDSEAHQAGLDEVRGQMQLFIQAIKDVCDRDVQAKIAARVKKLRSREGIPSAMENMMLPQPVDAEVVEVE